MATNMKSLNGYGFDATLLGGFAASEYAKKTDIPDNTGVDLLTVYPIGSIYMSVNSASPASLFGGTWEQLQDRFLLGAGSIYSAGDIGGEAEHTLTVNEMPSHTHNVTRYTTADGSTGTGYSRDQNVKTVKDTAYGPYPTGGGQPHNNMPPYLAVYMWKRVS